ncbi:MAG: SDR family oxidoreductase [Thermodesulfobacteriota bacterium]
MEKEKVILITGASSGIGLACARHLKEKGFQVYGTTRRKEFTDQEFQYPLLSLDVCVEDDGTRVITDVLERAGRLDVLINNAGFGIAGPIEETPISEIKAQFEVNFYGLIRMCQAVIPVMRKQGGGLIINISSIGGILSLPFQSAYSASKFAVEAITRAMRMELKGSKIKVTAVRPGDCCTDFTNRRRNLVTSKIYEEAFRRVLEVIEKNEREGMNPEKVAKLIEKIIHTPNPKANYAVGSFTEKLAICLERILPSSYFERLLMGFYHMESKT